MWNLATQEMLTAAIHVAKQGDLTTGRELRSYLTNFQDAYMKLAQRLPQGCKYFLSCVIIFHFTKLADNKYFIVLQDYIAAELDPLLDIDEHTHRDDPASVTTTPHDTPAFWFSEKEPDDDMMEASRYSCGDKVAAVACSPEILDFIPDMFELEDMEFWSISRN